MKKHYFFILAVILFAVISIQAQPDAPTYVTASPEQILSGASAVLNATSTGNFIQWYDVATGGTPLGNSASGQDYEVNPLSNTTYYAEAVTTETNSCTIASTSDQGFAGIMFRVNALNSAVIIDGFEFATNFVSTQTCDFKLYYKEGGVSGYEDDESAWTLWQTWQDTTITGLLYDETLRFLDINNFSILEGGSYSFYIVCTATNIANTSIFRGPVKTGWNYVNDGTIQVISGKTTASVPFDWIYDGYNSLYGGIRYFTPSTTTSISRTPVTVDVVSLPGSGTSGDPYHIETLTQLQLLSQTPTYWDKHFKQVANIDASATTGWNSGVGFSPIGNYTTPFTGSYDGQNFNITNLYINRSTNYNGLFGCLHPPADLDDISLTSVDISGGARTGGFAGGIDSLVYVNHCQVSGTVSGTDSTGGFVGYIEKYAVIDGCQVAVTVDGEIGTGGFAGYIFGGYSMEQNVTVSNCSASGNVTGTSETGGFAGNINGGYNGTLVTVSNCSVSSGTISATGDNIGGFAGYIEYNTVINDCQATVTVDGEGAGTGGFAGYINGGQDNSGTIQTYVTISNSSSSGTVTGTGQTGGFAGDIYELVTINNCSADNTTTGTLNVGGFVGRNYEDYSSGDVRPDILNSSATGNVTGSLRNIGGFVGWNTGLIFTSYATGAVHGTSATESRIGGFAGAVALYSNSEGEVDNCYSTGDVSTDGDNSTSTHGIGGFVGTYYAGGYIRTSYSTGSVPEVGTNYGGFCGRYPTGSNSENNFFDKTTAGITTDPSSATGKTTTEMKDVATFTNTATSAGLTSAWDFVGDPNNDAGNNDYWDIFANINNGYPSLSIVRWNGSNSNVWSDELNWNTGSVPTFIHNVIIPAGLGTYPTLSSALTCNNFTIESNASGTGSLIGQSNLTVNGTATVQRYMGGATWHLTSVPVNGESVQDMVTNNTFSTNDTQYGFGIYNEATDTWSTYTTETYSSAGNLTPGMGYETNIQSDGALSFAGGLNTSVVDVAITRSGNGWNLLGNPYPSALYANDLADASNNFIDINAGQMDASYVALYFWDPSTSQYEIINNSSVATYIPVGQAFFVKSKEGGGTASFTTAMQVHQPTDAFKSNSVNTNIILKATNGEQTKTTEFRFIEGTTLGLDPGYDAGLFNGTKDKFVLSSCLMQDNGIGFALQCFPADDFESVTVPIELNSVTNTVEFSVETSNLPSNIKVYLEDKLDNSFNLLDGTQTYAAQVNIGENSGRFYLHTSQQALDQMTELNDGEYEIIPQVQSSSLLICGNVPEGSHLSIIDLMGRTVFKTTVNSSTVNVPSLNNGIYIIKLINGRTTYTQKINWIK